jgi:glucose/mannose-6-phosphate isomerase
MMMLNESMKWPEKLLEGYDLGQDFYRLHALNFPRKIKRIVFVGMGGSGIAGKIFQTFFDKKSKISVVIVDSCELPNNIDAESLVIVMSYSGNTWEALDVLQESLNRFLPTIVIAHGGRAVEIAQARNIPFLLMPVSSAPRAALGHYLGILCAIFQSLGLLDGKILLDHWIGHAKRYLPQLSEQRFYDEFVALALDLDIFHLWGIRGYTDAVAFRAQTQFNENSKVAAVSTIFPEVCHNLIVGMSKFNKKPLVVVFSTDFLPLHLMTGLEVTLEILREKGVVLYKTPILGDTLEGQIFNIVLWSDFASNFLALARGVDALPVHIIDQLKVKQKHKGIS